MSWGHQTIGPSRPRSPRPRLGYPCPGLFRLAAAACFLSVAPGLYNAGVKSVGLAPLDWAAPAWTVGHIVLLAAATLLGTMAALWGAVYAATINIRSERISDSFIVVWQFLANGSLIWFLAIGTTMTATLGREGARASVLGFGAERATLYTVGTGCTVGLLSACAFLLASSSRLPFSGYCIFSTVVSLVAARRHYTTFEMEGKAWIAAGLAIPALLLISALFMIERDRRLRRLMMEQGRFPPGGRS